MSLRPSSVANRTSYAAGLGSQTSNQATLNKLYEKRKELDAVTALEKATNAYLERIVGLADDCDIMALAGEVHGQVSEQWPRMFHILNLFLASRQSSEEINDPQGEVLVRIPIEDVDSNTSASSD
ncbi:hypothetical protein BDP27DRAFT_1263310 [Rhodocollybia butyracea]|uniref:DASH complex subunit DAD2 n=1 Tax=Rhodocollybia butyracea TaxID=206335 RepID=A0A9P5U9D1_9AGAR|nr:hypothetical protein BDP27DRAFT_1263310 [Rhodocollybia butyracea]